MSTLQTLLENNRKWAEGICAQQPDFFAQLAQQQSPEYLWVGCADSRVPPGQITGLPPGQIFVHRNIANVVVHTDLNCLSVIQHAVEFLKVKHIIVAGHYGCGGVAAALAAEEQGAEHGRLDNWLRHIREVYRLYCEELQAISDFAARLRRLCELNVVEQASHVSAYVADMGGRQLHIHGWIYNLADGRLRDLNISRKIA